jgi:GTP-binding protein EngB required for normal cell division
MELQSTSSADRLNEFQAGRLRITCQYVDKLLGDIQTILNSTTSKAAFPRYAFDVAPAQRQTIEDYIARIRAQLVRVLDGQSIPREEPSIPASRAIHVALGAIDIAVEELKPRYMRGYGDLPEAAVIELNGIIGELRSLVSKLDRYLVEGVGQDLKLRLQRLEQKSNDLELLSKIETAVADHGLVEFRTTIASILDRAEDKTFEIAFFGRVSSGKSSLLNAILETDTLPIGVTPITAVPTRITYGERSSMRVSFAEAPAKTEEVARLVEFATEQQNPGNSRGVTRIVVTLPSARLRDGVTFVDTPGLGSLATSGAAETIAYLPKCDLAVVLIDAGSTLTTEDLQTILTLREAAVPVNVLLSKADLLGPEDRGKIIQYVREHIASECKLDLPVHPVSTLPSFREMLDQWFECEIVPLYDQAQQLRASSLRRKIGILRESVGSALKARMTRGKQSAANSKELIRAAEALLRRTTGEIEEMRSLCEREIAEAAAEIPEVIRSAASRLIASWSRNDSAPVVPGQMVRDAIAHFLQLRVKKLQEALSTFAAQLRLNLKQCASDLGLPSAPGDGEFQAVIRGAPLLDPQPFTSSISRPSFSRLLGHHFAERRVAKRIESQLGRPFLGAVDIYWRLLQEWSDSTVEQLRQLFDTYAEDYRAQAEQALGGKAFDHEELAAVQAILLQLETDSAPGRNVPNPERIAASSRHESSKTV